MPADKEKEPEPICSESVAYTKTGKEVFNNCTGQAKQAEVASATNLKKASQNPAVPEEDAATISDTLALNGTKEKLSGPALNLTSKWTIEQLEAQRVGASLPAPSNATVPALKTEKTVAEGVAIKPVEAKKPCDQEKVKVAQVAPDVNTPAAILPFPNKPPKKDNPKSLSQMFALTSYI